MTARHTSVLVQKMLVCIVSGEEQLRRANFRDNIAGTKRSTELLLKCCRRNSFQHHSRRGQPLDVLFCDITLAVSVIEDRASVLLADGTSFLPKGSTIVNSEEEFDKLRVQYHRRIKREREHLGVTGGSCTDSFVTRILEASSSHEAHRTFHNHIGTKLCSKEMLHSPITPTAEGCALHGVSPPECRPISRRR